MCVGVRGLVITRGQRKVSVVVLCSNYCTSVVRTQNAGGDARNGECTASISDYNAVVMYRFQLRGLETYS